MQLCIPHLHLLRIGDRQETLYECIHSKDNVFPSSTRQFLQSASLCQIHQHIYPLPLLMDGWKQKHHRKNQQTHLFKKINLQTHVCTFKFWGSRLFRYSSSSLLPCEDFLATWRLSSSISASSNSMYFTASIFSGPVTLFHRITSPVTFFWVPGA